MSNDNTDATVTKQFYAQPAKFGFMDQKPFLLEVGDRVQIVSVTRDYYDGSIRTFRIRSTKGTGFIGGGYTNIKGDDILTMDTPDAFAIFHHTK